MCGAHTRRGTLCRKPKLEGRPRCKLHGGASTGPPKGSRNAMKHGLYSQVFTAEEAERIEQILEEGDKRLDLSQEIATMRFLVERAMKSKADLATISAAMDSTRRLMLAQHRIEGQPADALTEAIESMLEEVAEEYGLQ